MKAIHKYKAQPTESREVCRLVLPIDVGPLSPNVRAHWSKKHRVAVMVDRTCFGVWHKSGKPRAQGPVIVTITLRRSRLMDKDNALASCKAVVDGLFKDRITPDDGPDYVTFAPVIQVVGKQYRERPEVEVLVEAVE